MTSPTPLSRLTAAAIKYGEAIDAWLQADGWGERRDKIDEWFLVQHDLEAAALAYAEAVKDQPKETTK